MQKASQALEVLRSGEKDEVLIRLYGKDALSSQRERYEKALSAYLREFGDDEVAVISAPGRTELGGNHTDHNHGRVLAGSVDLDVIAVASPAPDSFARVRSDVFSPDEVDMNDQGRYEKEQGRSPALIRGIARRLDELGCRRGGYRAYTTSRVPRGSGVSSSAAFEVLLTSILNFFYNDGAIDPVTVAQISQYAEREYFGKPCGLMDQAACALGGICEMDFAAEDPAITRVPFDFAASGYKLCLVQVGGDHSDLTDCYAALPARMKAVAAYFGKETLHEVSRTQLWEALPRLREAVGDEAVLAALHFVEETERVPRERMALTAGRFAEFLRLVTESGHSSYEYLQNVLIPKEGASQGAAVALHLASVLLRDSGAWRIHGGGFGGTIQCFVPDKEVPAFRERMEQVFGPGSCQVLLIRPVGPVQVL